MRLQIQVFNAATRQAIEAMFASFARERPDALFVASDTFLTTRRVQLVNLAARHAIPTAFPNRESAEIGGLMSYGASISDAWRQSGAYVGPILKGTKPADLPVVQSSNSSWSLTSQPPGCLASPCHRHCWSLPTR